MRTSVRRAVVSIASGIGVVLATFQASAQGVEPGIEGVWRVTRHGVNCQTGMQVNAFPALMTFHKDGTITSDAVGPGSTAAEGTSEHGVWQREPGRQRYSFRILSYGWDDTGAFEGSAEITGELQVTTRNDFSYNASIQFFDPNGGPLGPQHCGSATGTRFE